MWNVCTKEPYLNVEHIFPLAQVTVGQLVSWCAVNTGVKRIIVFGSAVTSLMNPWSDIDLFLEGVSRKELSGLPLVDYPLDLICDKDLEDCDAGPLLDDIGLEGVVVYER